MTCRATSLTLVCSHRRCAASFPDAGPLGAIEFRVLAAWRAGSRTQSEHACPARGPGRVRGRESTLVSGEGWRTHRTPVSGCWWLAGRGSQSPRNHCSAPISGSGLWLRMKDGVGGQDRPKPAGTEEACVPSPAAAGGPRARRILAHECVHRDPRVKPITPHVKMLELISFRF